MYFQSVIGLSSSLSVKSTVALLLFKLLEIAFEGRIPSLNLNSTFATLFVIYVILVIVHFDLKLIVILHRKLLLFLTVYGGVS